jgi:hypothetical protein
MNLPDAVFEPDDNKAEECTEDPYTCQCDECRALWNDVQPDRRYDEGKEAA